MAGKYPEIGVENFGPIKRGKIELKPLTVFVGPNNSGKSYLALFVNSLFKMRYFDKINNIIKHSIINSSIPIIIAPEIGEMSLNVPVEFISSVTFWGRHLTDKTKSNEPLFAFNFDFSDGCIKIPSDKIYEFCNVISKIIYGEILINEIEKQFSFNYNNLRQMNQKYSHFSIETDKIRVSYKTTQRKNKHLLSFEAKPLSINLSESSVNFLNYNKESNEIIIDSNPEFNKFINNWREKKPKDWKLFLVSIIMSKMLDELTSFLDKKNLYTPAGRLGFLQARQLIVGEMVKSFSVAKIGFDIPTLTKPVTDFLARLIELTEATPKGSLFNLACDLEKELLGGEIILDSANEAGSTEIKYKFQDNLIPLHRASSTVSEIASLILDLKYHVEPGSVLIIEEPETHLHPGNQRILAKYLAKLVRNDVQVLITTHSEIILEQLNNQLLQGELKESKSKKKLKNSYIKDDYLKKDEVGVYVFEKNTRVKSPGIYNVNAVEIDNENGISMDEFDRIKDSLYNETVRLRTKVERKKMQ